MPLTNEQIEARAQEIAHENSSACKSSRAFYNKDVGHGRACKKLAKVIAAAMRQARDGDQP